MKDYNAMLLQSLEKEFLQIELEITAEIEALESVQINPSAENICDGILAISLVLLLAPPAGVFAGLMTTMATALGVASIGFGTALAFQDSETTESFQNIFEDLSDLINNPISLGLGTSALIASKGSNKSATAAGNLISSAISLQEGFKSMLNHEKFGIIETLAGIKDLHNALNDINSKTDNKKTIDSESHQQQENQSSQKTNQFQEEKSQSSQINNISDHLQKEIRDYKLRLEEEESERRRKIKDAEEQSAKEKLEAEKSATEAAKAEAAYNSSRTAEAKAHKEQADRNAEASAQIAQQSDRIAEWFRTLSYSGSGGIAASSNMKTSNIIP